MNIVFRLKELTFIFLAFAIPFSVALTNILIVIFTLLWLIEGDFKNKLLKTSSSKWFVSIFILAILYLVGMFNGEYHSDLFYVIKRVLLLLLFIPVLTSRLSKLTIEKSIYVFLFTNFLAAFIAILINLDIIQPLFSTASISAFLKYNYHNILLSFSSLLCFVLYIKSKHKFSFIYLLLILIYTLSIFTEAGRAGQLTFNFFFLLFAFYYLKNHIKYSVSIFVFLLIVNYFSYSNSPIFKHRVDHLTHIVKHDGKKKNKKNKEKDIRYVFAESTTEMVFKKPIFGYGTGSFSDFFKQQANSSYDLKKHKTPHNNYLYILFELGLIGLIAFLSIFYYQIRELLHKNKHNWEVLLLPLFMLILMFFDSYMFVFTITVFYIYMYKIFKISFT